MIATVYADSGPSSFTLYEDDGTTLQYEADGRPKYHHRTTEISQQQIDADTVRVRVEAAQNVNGAGPFSGAILSRHNVVRLVVNELRGASVTLDGAALPEHLSEAAFQAAASGWMNAGHNLILAKSAKLNVNAAKEFVFELASIAPRTSVNFVCDHAFTTPGVSIYVAGNIPELGGFDPAQAIKLEPNVYYGYIVNPPLRNLGPGPGAPVWTGVIAGLPVNTTFEWKCIRKREDGTGAIEFEPGPNNIFTTGASGYAGRAFGSF
jgi:alpha-glucosidase